MFDDIALGASGGQQCDVFRGRANGGAILTDVDGVSVDVIPTDVDGVSLGAINVIVVNC